MRNTAHSGCRLAGLVAATGLASLGPAAAVEFDWALVGDTSTPCENQSAGCFGAVGYLYGIAVFEVTNAQYSEFLNAVADDDPNALYSAGMVTSHGGISRSGTAGSYSYSAIAGREEWAVNFVSFPDGLRFANWLHNGQPTGAQGNATTEDGAYTITVQGLADNSIVRNAGAARALPSEDEWYKAAYWDEPNLTWRDYPAGSDTQTVCSAPTASPNSANCNDPPGGVVPVGSYTNSLSPYFTADQGGNVWELTEAVLPHATLDLRIARGGAWNQNASNLAAASRQGRETHVESAQFGFRVVNLPEPAGVWGLLAGATCLAARRRARRRREVGPRRDTPIPISPRPSREAAPGSGTTS